MGAFLSFVGFLTVASMGAVTLAGMGISVMPYVHEVVTHALGYVAAVL